MGAADATEISVSIDQPKANIDSDSDDKAKEAKQPKSKWEQTIIALSL